MEVERGLDFVDCTSSLDGESEGWEGDEDDYEGESTHVKKMVFLLTRKHMTMAKAYGMWNMVRK